MAQFSNLLTDEAALKEIGLRLERRRLELNLTQLELAREAGLGKRTIERIEDGGSCQLGGFLRVLRALGILADLEALLPESKPGPMELLKAKGRERLRATGSRSRSDKETSRIREDATPWKWGEGEDSNDQEPNP